jgi:hypothetical protein
MRILAALLGAMVCGGTAAAADELHVSCRALTPWNGGGPAKSGFSMFIDIDPVHKVVKFQPDDDRCCQTYGNTADDAVGKRTVAFDVNRVAFGTSAPGQPPDLYTLDIYSGTLTHDFGYPSGAGADRHIISIYQCIDLKSN